MFQKAGWLPPLYERYVNGNLEYLTRRVGMELFLTAQGEAGLQRARFGPIIPIHNRLTHQAAVRDSVNRSWEYLFALSATVRIQAYSDIEAAYWYQALDQSPPPVRESILSPIEAGMAQLPPGSTLLLDHEEFMTASYIQSQVGGGTDIVILDLETFLQDREATLKAEGMPSGAARAVANNELFALVEGRIESGEVFSLNPLALIRDDFVLKPVNGSLYRVMAGVHRDQ
jgi:hypothetical protein